MRVRASFLRGGAFVLGFVGCLDFGALSPEGDHRGTSDSGSDDSAADAPVASYDAGDGATFDVAPSGFIILLEPWHVTLDPGESAEVNVNVVRGTSFSDTVDITVQDLGASLSANPVSVTIPSSASQGKFTVKADPGAPLSTDVTTNVIAVSKRDTSLAAQAALGVHVGSMLVATSTSQSVALPAWATSVFVKVWGAGGGGGGAIVIQDGMIAGGSPGGGGGFASAVIPTDPSLPLELVVGTGGGPGSPNPATPTQSGGGGGGYSAVSQAGKMLVVAGAGGGGVSGQGENKSGQCGGGLAPIENPALAGGGGDAEQGGVPNRSATTSAPGTARPNGGGTSGDALKGGDAAQPAIAGGLPGGGRGGAGDNICMGGGVGGGGGGAGWFGGAGGEGAVQGDWPNIQSGGGGSGMVIVSASQVTQAVGLKYWPGGNFDADYAVDAGRGGASATADAGALPGAAGRIVVRFAKP